VDNSVLRKSFRAFCTYAQVIHIFSTGDFRYKPLVLKILQSFPHYPQPLLLLEEYIYNSKNSRGGTKIVENSTEKINDLKKNNFFCIDFVWIALLNSQIALFLQESHADGLFAGH